MNWLDVVILVILAIAVFSGLRVGLIKVLFGVVGIIVGIVLAGRFSESLGDKMTFISNPGWAHIAAFAIILVAVMIIAAIAGGVLSKMISLVLLGWVNRLAGAVLGLFVGAFFMGAILSIWINYLGPSATVASSALANFLLDKFPIALGLLPSQFDPVRNFFK
jgi:membrane protein required for colicin V production